MNKNHNLIFLGPKGSYTEIAADNFINKEKIKIYNREVRNSILGVINSVDNSDNNIGVVPLENSIEGIVRETVDNLIKTKTKVLITGETIVPISHCLISKSNNFKNIDKIISMPQALAQCTHFLEQNLPQAEKLPAKSTSEAVRNLKDLPENYAAIGSAKAAEIYGINIIQTGINDEKENFTRFVSLGSNIPDPTGEDKTSIALTINNKPGALVDILTAFKDNNINLSYIESRPSKKVFGDYTFFIDFDGHIKDQKIKGTLEKITPYVNFYRFLGSYAKKKLIKI